MSTFLTKDFLLKSEPAKVLYHNYAKKQPIVDYHCHLSPEDVATNKQFTNLTDIWLKGDHYKWRAMRTLGVDEKYITGNATDYEKFLAWAGCVPKLIGNPLYHWTHLELRRPFGITDRVLNSETAESIWNESLEMLKTPEFSAWGIINQMNVKVICTTDDPISNLEHHIAFGEMGADFKMLPTFRPDKAGDTSSVEGYVAYIKELSKASNIEITNFNTLKDALVERHSYFHSVGCRLSDHGISYPKYRDYTTEELNTIVEVLLSGNPVSDEDDEKLNTALIQLYGKLNTQKGWAMQIHMGPIRNNNSRMFNKLGPDTGFDSIGDEKIAVALSKLLDSMDKTDNLPKTILYVINSSDNDVIGTMIGNFQDGKTPGKVQFGSGWWFHDQKVGMLKQMESLSSLGVLSQFVGMLTDSRSFLSYTRHEYFRRILCNLIGSWVQDGEAPLDYQLLGGMVEDICYNNSINYFKFPG